MVAKDLLVRGESAVVIFTDGTHFSHRVDGAGSTGYWIIDSRRTIDKVIIYHRRKADDVNEIYVGTWLDTAPSPVEGRHIVSFTGLDLVGSTKMNWYKFAATGANPVRYLHKLR